MSRGNLALKPTLLATLFDALFEQASIAMAEDHISCYEQAGVVSVVPISGSRDVTVRSFRLACGLRTVRLVRASRPWHRPRA